MNIDQTMRELSAQAKTWPLQGHTTFAGMKIAIENRRGTVRSGTGLNGREWSVTMPFDYGYIKKSVGKDRDEIDCFLGPNANAKFVYVIHQGKENNTADWDEDKCMLGFDSADAALRAYKSAFNGPDLFQSMSVIPLQMFRKKVGTTSSKKRIDKLTAFGTMSDTGIDYRQFREGTAIQPRTMNHPPSLKNPIKVDVENPDEKKVRKKSKKDRKFYEQMDRRQSSKPEIANTTTFLPFTQG